MSGKTTILYISLILSLSLMGVGYAAWNDTLTINTTITTGDVFVDVNTQKGRIFVDNGKYLDIDVVDNEIGITGVVYPGFSDSLDIDILDKGSVPVMLKSVEGSNDEDVASLNNTNKYHGLRTFSAFGPKLGQDEVRESFNLNISPDYRYTENDSFDSFGVMSSYDSYNSFETMTISDSYNTSETMGIDYSLLESIYGEIDRLYSEIDDLNKRIEDYRSIDERYDFEYNILFEQAL